jgi:hypothetical protein
LFYPTSDEVCGRAVFAKSLERRKVSACWEVKFSDELRLVSGVAYY